MRALLAVVAIAVSCVGPSTFVSTPTPTASPTPAAATTAPPASPSATAAGDPVRANAAGPLRTDDILVANSWDVARIWLVDTTWTRPARAVVSWSYEEPYGPRSSWSRDGRVIVLSARGPAGRAAIYAVRTETAEVRVLASDASADLRDPVISPDGARVAYTRMPAADRNDGLWTVSVAGGSPGRIVEPAAADTRALGWSADGAWLALTHEGSFHVPSAVEVFIVAAMGGALRSTGAVAWPAPGSIAWHPRDPRLLLAASGAPTTIPESLIHHYDVRAASARLIYRGERRSIAHVSWHPSGERLLYAETVIGAENGQVISRDLAGNVTVLGESGRFLVGLRWAPDGRRVIAHGGGDDSVQGIVELGTRGGTTICLRSDDPALCI